MKNRASGFIKQIIGVITSIAKAKSSLALKTTKMSAIRSRLVILSLLRNKKVLLSTISHKLHALLVGQHDQDGGEGINNRSNITNEEDDDADDSKAIVIYNNAMQSYQSSAATHEYMIEQEEEDDKYPDLTHSLFEDQDGGGGCSVIELVRHSKEEEGEEFILEDEIDQVADLFIKRFHRQIKMQKQLSFKRYQEMLERSV